MKNSDTELLEKEGWKVECLSPLEIRHAETGSFASKLAATYVLACLRENDEDAVSAANEKSPEEELAGVIKKILQWVRATENIDTEMEWELLFSLVFSKNGSQEVSRLRTKLGIPFDYCDPDTSYKEDVLAYTNALRDLAKQLAPYFPAFNDMP